MDDLGKRIRQVSHELQEYVETKVELTILKISDRITYWIGKSVQQLIAYTILAIGLLFGLTALAIYLGDLLGEEWAGYLIVSSPLVIIAIILILAKPKTMIKSIQDQILSDLLESLDETEGEKAKKLPSKEKTTKELN